MQIYLNEKLMKSCSRTLIVSAHNLSYNIISLVIFYLFHKWLPALLNEAVELH